MLVACVFAWLAPPALAADANYCVTCKNPDQTYRCRVTGDAPNAGDALKLYCIIRTAQDGGHSSCSAERTTSGCGGPEKVYAYDGAALSAQIASNPRVRDAAEQIQRQRDAFAKPQETTTMFELGGRAVSASRQGWQNARARIGGGSSAKEPAATQAPRTPLPDSAPASAPLPASAPVEAATATASPAPQSESRMKRASSAVGGFARKSYRCMRSLFRSCSDEASPTVQ